MAWLSGYNHRKQITIAGSIAGAQSDYQMRLGVYWDADKVPLLEFIEQVDDGANLHASQGIETDGTYLYTTSTTRLYKYTLAGAHITDVDAFHGDVDVVHAGDPVIVGTKIYAPAYDDPVTKRRVYVYNTSDLSYDSEFDITTGPMAGAEGKVGGDISFDGTYFWMSSYGESPDYIYKYNTSFVYQDESQSLGFKNCQGHTWYGSYVYAIRGHDKIQEYLYSGGSLVSKRSFSTSHYEGIDISPDGKYFWQAEAHAETAPVSKYFFYPYDTDQHNAVIISGHCQADFDDIRFTKSDGSSELDHWLESKTNSDNAIFWIEFDSIPESPDSTTFYIYYSKADASSGSNGNATFLLFDDFLGDALDTDKWDSKEDEGTIAIADSIIHLYTEAAKNKECYIYDKSTHAKPIAIGTRAKGSAKYPAVISMADVGGTPPIEADNLVSLGRLHSADYLYGRQRKATAQSEQAYSDATNWEDYQIYELQWQTDKVEYFQNAVSLGSSVNNVPSVNLYALLGCGTWSMNAAAHLYLDWVYLRNFVDPEPTWGDWGGEETIAPWNIAPRVAMMGA